MNATVAARAFPFSTDAIFANVDRFINQFEGAGGYPPFNMFRTGEGSFTIQLALAGFGEDDIKIEVEANALRVEAGALPEVEGAVYLHRGIARRAFRRVFTLAEHMEVVDAVLKDGILEIRIEHRVPDAAKPRKVSINSKS